MKQLFPPLAIIIISFTLLLAGFTKHNAGLSSATTDATVIACGSSAQTGNIAANDDGSYVPVLPGWGHYNYSITTNNDSAQFFFNQGLTMYYSYHLTEAVASFKEAARRDPNCMMAYWGQALAMGPYYNNYFYRMPATVLPVLQQMNALAPQANEREKGLAEAMNNRYSNDTTDAQRLQLNEAYSRHLYKLKDKYPADIDIKALYIDAVMLQHTWDFWETDGTAKAWTPQLVNLCEDILKVSPAHPAALHYEVHLVEASMHPEKALANAALLRTTLPGVSHMVHMSTHMYQRNGLYYDGVEVNNTAAGLQVYYDSMVPNLKLGLGSLTHFDAVGSFCAMQVNMYKQAMQASGRLHNMLVTTYSQRLSNTFLQYLLSMQMFVNVRSGKWKEVIDEPEQAQELHYARLLQYFGKGLAYLHLGDTTAAGKCLNKLRALLGDNSLKARNMPFNAPLVSAQIAEAILNGSLLQAKGATTDAITALEKAVQLEDGMIYREPKEWPLPARHFLGACLLQSNRPGEAEEVYRKDLLMNAGNGWSLLGLYQSLIKQNKTTEAAQYKTAFEHAFVHAEDVPPASAY